MSEKNKEIPPDLKERQREGYKLEWRKELRKAIPVKERMKIPLQKMPAREAEDRNKHFQEVNKGLNAKQAQEEAKKMLGLCQSAVYYGLSGPDRHSRLCKAHRGR